MKLKKLIVVVPLVLALSACGSKKITQDERVYLLDIKKSEMASTKTDKELLSDAHHFCERLDNGEKWIDVANSLDYYTDVRADYSYHLSTASVFDLCPKYKEIIINTD